jgi:branched-chain amino acid transport system substrate-binding protein
MYIGVGVGLQSPDKYVNVFKGVQEAIDELNASRPAGSKPLALRRAPANAADNVQVAAAFRDDPSVIGVVGHTESDATISAAAVYDDREHGGRNALVAVSPTASASAVTRASPWVFRVCPVVTQQASLIVRYMMDTVHLKRVAVVYRNDVSGREFLRSGTAAIQSAHADLLERDPFVEEISEFDLYAERIARGKPDGVLMYANSSDVLKLMRAVHRAGIHPAVFSQNGPSAADERADAAHDFDGLRYLSLYSPDRPLTATAKQFIAAYQQKYSSPPDHWAALSYDAAMLIGRAAQAVGADRSAIRDRIAAVGNGQPAYAGATGEIRFDRDRSPIDKIANVAAVSR